MNETITDQAKSAEQAQQAQTDREPRFSANELEQIVRRAAELQSLSGSGETPSFSEDDIQRIAADVGVSAEHVQEAVAELRARNLFDHEVEEHPLWRWLFGSTVVATSRRLPGTAADVQPRIEQSLEKDYGLQPVRRAPGMSIWEPTEKALEELEDVEEPRPWQRLVESRGLSLHLAAWDRDHVVVRATAGLEKSIDAWAKYWGIGLAIGLFLLWGWTDDAGLGVVLQWGLMVAATLTGAGIVLIALRWQLRQARRKLRLILDSVIDRGLS